MARRRHSKLSQKHFYFTKGSKTKDVLPALSLPHDPLLILLMVDALGEMPVASDTSDLRVVLELLLQLLVVVDGRPLSWGELRDRREGALRLQIFLKSKAKQNKTIRDPIRHLR